MVLREVFVMAAVGLAIGLPVALATTKFVKSFLFEMKPNDPWAIAGAAVVLVAGGGRGGLRTGVAGAADRSLERAPRTSDRFLRSHRFLMTA